MALSAQYQEELVHVPWSSIEEWLQTFRQIYSGDLEQQKEACDILLVWKARIPKLPVGAECTLGLLQVCLKDREWMLKIDKLEIPITCENDLRMMYSTVVMKVLNHISNIASKRQTSLFSIAKQLNIPHWIVDLRHDAAHGNELPSLDVMRVVANMLLSWLHEEYWAAEAKIIGENTKTQDLSDLNSKVEDELIEMLQIWTATELYIRTKYLCITDVPDLEFRNCLLSLYNSRLGDFDKINTLDSEKSQLEQVSKLILTKISKLFMKCKPVINGHELVVESIVNNEAFLPPVEILSLFDGEKQGETDNSNEIMLPQSFINFWKDLFILIQDKKFISLLFLHLIKITHSENETKHKRLIAALWVKFIAHAIRKQRISSFLSQHLIQKLEDTQQVLSPTAFSKVIENQIERLHPELKNVPLLSISNDIITQLKDKKFLKHLVLNVNEISEKYLLDVLKISPIFETDSEFKNKLINFVKIYSATQEINEKNYEDVSEADKIYTLQDLKKRGKIAKKHKNYEKLSDNTIRNLNWRLATHDYDWSTCAPGVLPWHLEKADFNKDLIVKSALVKQVALTSTRLEKIIDSNRLITHSKVQWENIMKKNKSKVKKKTETNSRFVVRKAMEKVRTMNQQLNVNLIK